MRRQEKWHHSESISNSDLRFTEGKFPMIDTARKRGSSQFAGFSRHQEAGPTSGSTSSLFCAPSKTAGGNVHLDRTPTSSSSSSFSWHRLRWVGVFVFLRLGIITMWCCHNPSSSQRHWYLFWFSCWIAPCYCSSLTLTIQTNYNTYFHLLIYLLTKYVV